MNINRKQKAVTNPDRSPVFNHEQSNDAEAEYDRLRDLAREEAFKRHQCFDRVCDEPETPLKWLGS